jgi:hypothetical protein
MRVHTNPSGAADLASGGDADDRSIDDLDGAICTLARHLSAETYRMLVLVREFDDRLGYAKWSFRSCAEWLAWRCGLSLSAAREKVRTAQALREMPAIAAAFADGRLSYSKVRALTRVVEWHDEDLLLAYALQATAAQVEERCRQIRNSRPESASRAQRAWERRSLALWRDDARGVMSIRVELPIEQGELVAKALERAVAAGEAASGLEFAAKSLAAVRDLHDGAEVHETAGNGWRAQQADALVAVARAYLRGDAPAAEGGAAHTAAERAPVGATADHYQVVMHVDAKSLRGGAGRADLPIDTLKRLCCDGSIVTVVEDEDGAPLDVGRKQRTVSTPLKRALHARDRGCAFPGCHNKRYLDAHHIRHWADGGATRLENLTLLCSHHHTLLHEGGYTIRRDDVHGPLVFRRADGRAIPRAGYRLDDVRDDDAPSAEGWGPAPRNPSAEVREAAAGYVIRAAARALTGHGNAASIG